MFKNSLDHTTSVRMAGELLYFPLKGSDDELYPRTEELRHVCRRRFFGDFAYDLYALLDYMIAVGVMYASEKELQKESAKKLTM